MAAHYMVAVCICGVLHGGEIWHKNAIEASSRLNNAIVVAALCIA